MRYFFKGRLFKAISVIVIFLLIVMIVAAATHANTGSSSFFGVIISPFQKLASEIGNGVGGFFSDLATAGEKSKEIEELKDKVSELEKQVANYESDKIELEMYRSYLDIKEDHPDYVFTFAEVVGFDRANAYGSFVINKGSLSGVEVGYPVVSDNYLVGIVSRVEPTYSVVKSVLDPSVSVGAYDTRTREYGYTLGDASLYSEGCLYLDDLSKDSMVSAGSIVCTSGLGGTYPRDLIIGTVTEIVSDEYSSDLSAVVKLSADLSKLKEVFVITDFDGKSSPSHSED